MCAPGVALAGGYSQNPNSSYAYCHVSSPPSGCDLLCGPDDMATPSSSWCDFAGYICAWDNYWFLISTPAPKGGKVTYEKTAAGAWLGPDSAGEAAATGRVTGLAMGTCLGVKIPELGYTDALLFCEAAVMGDTGDLSCVWNDFHCVDWDPNDPTDCWWREG